MERTQRRRVAATVGAISLVLIGGAQILEGLTHRGNYPLVLGSIFLISGIVFGWLAMFRFTHE
jgi:hypothetical protein